MTWLFSPMKTDSCKFLLFSGVAPTIHFLLVASLQRAWGDMYRTWVNHPPQDISTPLTTIVIIVIVVFLFTYMAFCLPQKLMRNQIGVYWARNRPERTLFPTGDRTWVSRITGRQSTIRLKACPQLKGCESDYLLFWAMTQA